MGGSSSKSIPTTGQNEFASSSQSDQYQQQETPDRRRSLSAFLNERHTHSSGGDSSGDSSSSSRKTSGSSSGSSGSSSHSHHHQQPAAHFNEAKSGTMQDPAYRQQCFHARDEYFTCTEHKVDCENELVKYSELCPPEWKVFFDQQHKRDVVQQQHNAQFQGPVYEVDKRYATIGFGTGQKRQSAFAQVKTYKEPPGGFMS